jgi:hypothetical protein
MTGVEIVDVVHRLDRAASQTIAWMSCGGLCCGAIRQHGYCTRPSCAERHEHYAAYWGREAAHLALALLSAAEPTP